MLIKQHVPAFAESPVPLTASYTHTAELLGIDWVAAFKCAPGFHRFSVGMHGSGQLLMCEFDNGFRWWVVGYLTGAPGEIPVLLDLPVWVGRKSSELARAPLRTRSVGAGGV